MFKRKSRDPLKEWDQSSSRLGWSVLDGRLVEAGAIRGGKLLQSRHVDDGGFASEAGFTPDTLNRRGPGVCSRRQSADSQQSARRRPEIFITVRKLNSLVGCRFEANCLVSGSPRSSLTRKRSSVRVW